MKLPRISLFKKGKAAPDDEDEADAAADDAADRPPAKTARRRRPAPAGKSAAEDDLADLVDREEASPAGLPARTTAVEGAGRDVAAPEPAAPATPEAATPETATPEAESPKAADAPPIPPELISDFPPESDQAEDGAGDRRRLIAIVAGGVVAILVVFGAAWWFLIGSGDEVAAPADHRPPPSASEGPRVSLDLPPPPTPGVVRLRPLEESAPTATPMPAVTEARSAPAAPPSVSAPSPTAPSSPAMATPTPVGPGGDAPSMGDGQAPPAAPGRAAPTRPSGPPPVVDLAPDPATGAVLVAVAPATIQALPELTPVGPLPPAPDLALLDPGQLPRVGADGRRPWQVYARPFEPTESRPRVAVVIAGLGLSRAITEAAITRLPSAVTLAFDPYAKDIEQWVTAARAAGHEVLLGVPMEPVDFPVHDPGPYALLTAFDAAENVKRLEILMGRFTGYVGILPTQGAQFLATEGQMRPLLDMLRRRGLLYVDPGHTAQSRGPKIAAETGLPFAVANAYLERELSRAALDAQLAQLEATARQKNGALTILGPYPVMFERLLAWIAAATARNVVLAPVSALAAKPPNP